MPLINGRFYANPAYGRALERARNLEAGRDEEPEEISARYVSVSTHGGQRSAAQHAKQGKESQTSIGNRVYNETGGLRAKPGAKPGAPGSAEDLHNGRVAIANVAGNREKAGIAGGIAPDKVSPSGQKTPQYKDAQGAAAQASHTDITGGAANFYLEHGQGPPKWAKGRKMTSYGPFNNASGGGDVPKGADTQIVIVH